MTTSLLAHLLPGSPSYFLCFRVWFRSGNKEKLQRTVICKGRRIKLSLPDPEWTVPDAFTGTESAVPMRASPTAAGTGKGAGGAGFARQVGDQD